MPFGLGEAPPGYNPKVHGPYNPAVFYGKKDTPFMQVKVGELPGWIARRPLLNPIAAGRFLSRTWWKWHSTWTLPRHAGMAGYIQFAAAWVAFWYVAQYKSEFSHHKQQRAHW